MLAEICQSYIDADHLWIENLQMMQDRKAESEARFEQEKQQALALREAAKEEKARRLKEFQIEKEAESEEKVCFLVCCTTVNSHPFIPYC
jgi:uncharacterized damage-inducible protein DinB